MSAAAAAFVFLRNEIPFYAAELVTHAHSLSIITFYQVDAHCHTNTGSSTLAALTFCHTPRHKIIMFHMYHVFIMQYH